MTDWTAASAQLRRASENFSRAIDHAFHNHGGRYAAADAYRAYLVESGQYVYTTGRPARPARRHGYLGRVQWIPPTFHHYKDDSHD